MEVAMEKTHRSYARWPEGVYCSAKGDTISTDDHHSEDAANAVCLRLQSDGFGGDNEFFPVETWVTPIPFEEQYPEEAETLMQICEERAKAKAKGKRLKPLFLDAPDPIRRDENKVGRNDACPCGSGRKYKKCCM
jgi:hypothetical protein